MGWINKSIHTKHHIVFVKNDQDKQNRGNKWTTKEEIKLAHAYLLMHGPTLTIGAKEVVQFDDKHEEHTWRHIALVYNHGTCMATCDKGSAEYPVRPRSYLAVQNHLKSMVKCKPEWWTKRNRQSCTSNPANWQDEYKVCLDLLKH